MVAAQDLVAVLTHRTDGKDCGEVSCAVCGAVAMREVGLMTDFEKGRAEACQTLARWYQLESTRIHGRFEPTFAALIREFAHLPPTHVAVPRETLAKVRESLNIARLGWDPCDGAACNYPCASCEIMSALAALDAVEVGK